jgi:phenylacetate-CoA ligase
MEQKGLHINEDHFIPEIIDPVTLEVLPAGEKGEMVFTTVSKEGLPLIRYRTRDLTRLDYASCACGRTLVRMEKCTGRSDDMLIIRGVNIFPAQIEAILVDIEGLEPQYQLIVDKAGALDTLELHVEVSDKIFSDSGGVKELQKIEKRILKDMKDYLGIAPNVKLVEPSTLKKTDARIIDKRTI